MSPRTFKSGVHLFAALEKTTCRHCSILRSMMSKRPLQVSPFLNGCCSVNELRGTFWLSIVGVHRAVRCTWTKWQWKLVHSPFQHPPAPCLRNYGMERVSYSIQHICRTRWVYSHRSHRAYHEFSTSVRWLSYVDIAWLVGVGQQLLFWGFQKITGLAVLTFQHVYLTLLRGRNLSHTTGLPVLI